ncbi:MAG: hypothetical protein FJY98_00055 [Candidatus Liptonbacteria bacterium]|nr:hypothetical protein [Candidatus Liptonbacteria bacterium]
MESFLHRLFPEERLVTILRWTLGIIFIWFGILKIAGFNPVFDLIHSVTPFLASGTGLILLGSFEAGIGMLLLLNHFLFLTHLLLLGHLAGTFLTFIMGPEVIFSPYFPVLSLSGEFVVKNITLVMAGLLVLMHEVKKRGWYKN